MTLVSRISVLDDRMRRRGRRHGPHRSARAGTAPGKFLIISRSMVCGVRPGSLRIAVAPFRWPRRLFRRLLRKPDDQLVDAVPLPAVHKPSRLIGLSPVITSVTTCTHLRVFPRFFLCYRRYFKNMPREKVRGEPRRSASTLFPQALRPKQLTWNWIPSFSADT